MGPKRDTTKKNKDCSCVIEEQMRKNDGTSYRNTLNH